MTIVPKLSREQVAAPPCPPREPHPVLTPYGRFWTVSEAGVLVCVCVYKRGAAEVLRRLTQAVHRRTAP